MATTAASSTAANPSASAAAIGGRPQLKSSIGGSAGAPNRRSTQSPIDGPQRRNSAKQAWQSNNPAPQKYSGPPMPAATSSPTPGQAASMKNRAPTLPQGGETDTHDKHMHDRQLYLLANLAAHQVTVTVKSGAQYTGVVSGTDTKSHDLGVSLKYAKLLKHGPGEMEDKIKEGSYVDGGPEHQIVFDAKDVADIAAQGIILDDSEYVPAQQNGVASSGFKTDADISGNLGVRERELQKWQPDEPADSGLTLEDHGSKEKGPWNQFATNETLFGVKSTYDENLYTTKLDRSHPSYKEREAAAARLAAEIEGENYSASMNPHVAEERGLAVPDDSGLDEEDKYSGVQRSVPSISSNNPNRYTPPALRAPTGHPTVPGAPHDPAIISSQLARPETIQQKQQRQQPSEQPVNPVKAQEEANNKPKDRPALPQGLPANRTINASSAMPSKPAEQIEKEVSQTFKNFVSSEKERVKKKRADMVTRDRESKLKELKKFAENFTLKSTLPDDLVPILAKDKAKQKEIKEKARLNAAKSTGGNVPMASAPSTGSFLAGAGLPAKLTGKPLQPNSFAAKDPTRFAKETMSLIQSLPPGMRTENPSLAANLQRMQNEKSFTPRAPMPLPEPGRQFPPTGPAASNAPAPPSSTISASGPKRLNVNAKPFEFKPNPNASAFTPTFGGQSSNASPSPTLSAHAQGTSRATSPTVFGIKKDKVKSVKDRPSIKKDFNPFKRMKLQAATKSDSSVKKKPGPGNEWIVPPWQTQPLWISAEDEEKEKKAKEVKETKGYDEKQGKAKEGKSYKDIFGQPTQNHSPQPPPMMPPQPHHQQLPPHMPHINQPHHVPHQPPHGHMQPHLGIPPHYEQDHMRSTPSSVMPSPSMHNATTVPPYQQSPAPHPSQLAMYPGGQAAMGPYVPGGPAGPQYGYYNGGFRGAAGAPHMMVQGAPQPMPFPGGQMGGQFMHPQMYGSPQQPHAYLSNGPPPPSQGYHSPGRSAPMMMHQGSSQGTPGQQHLVPYAMQPGQSGPMYVPQGQQQQSELLFQGQPWLPQRPQSTVPLSSAVPSPHLRHKHMVVQPSPGTASATPLLAPELAAFASSPPLAPVPGFPSHPLQRSQTSNTAQGVGGEGRGGGRGKGGKNYHGGGGGGRGGSGRGGNVHMGNPPAISMPSPTGAHAMLMDTNSNNGSMIVGMMRGQPIPHQGPNGPPPPHYYHHGPPQNHFPPGGRGYGGPHHPPQGPPPQQMPPQQQAQQQQQQPPPPPQQAQQAGDAPAGEEGK